jgi:hypothetical protein
MMKRYYSSTYLTCLFIIHFILIWIHPAHGATIPAHKANTHTSNHQILTKMSALQVPFVANAGQVDEEVRFYARTFGGVLYVTEKGEMVYSLPLIEARQGNLPGQELPKQLERKGWVLKERLLGSLNPDIKNIEKANTKVNHFIGNDKSKWKSNVSSYNEVSLGEIYKGISLNLRAYGNNVEKIFTVNPRSRPEAIRLAVEGAFSLATNNKGELEVETGLGTVRFRAPIAYQEKEGERTYIKVAYSVDNKEYGFSVADYDRQIPLIIDPMLASTFIGGSSTDEGKSIALDSSGNVYILGRTQSNDYPTTTGAYDEGYNALEDLFISKLNSDLTTLLVSTYIGGSGQDWAAEIALDSAGNVYIAGTTNSSNYPSTTGAYDETYALGWDTMISKLNSDLDTLLASTFIGGGNDDSAFALVLSESYVYVAGKNYLGGYPVPIGAGMYQEANAGLDDIVVSRLDLDLTTHPAATYIGGPAADVGIAIALDSTGNVIVFGYSQSADYPVTGGVWDETHNGDYDLVVSKLDANLQTLQASTYIGGTAADMAMAGGSLVLDSLNNVYVTGYTSSADFPTTTGAYDDTINGLEDAFVSKLSDDLSLLLASTFIGGSGNDRGKTPAIDSAGNVYVSGYTSSADFPTTTGAYDRTHNGSNDIFISRLDGDFAILQVSTFIGGSGNDNVSQGDSILDSSGNVYVTGTTESTDFPTTSGAYDTIHNGGSDVFVSKLTGDLSLSPGTYYVDISQVSEGDGSVGNPWKTLHYALQDINSGPSGTYILNVAAGTYSIANGEADATLVINQDNVTIQGAGAGSTIINGMIDATWQIGIEINASNVTISGCEVSNFTMNGINIYAGTGQIVEDCDIHDNDWGIYTNNTSPEIRKNKIYDNTTRGIYITVFDSAAYAPVIKNNLIYTTTGTMEYGIEVYTASTGSIASPSIYHNTIDGGNQYGIYIREDVEPITAEIKYNIITNFVAGIRFTGTTPSMTIDYNDVWGNTTNYDGCTAGTNDISLDPSFVGGGDYNLQSGSPCIDAIPTSAGDTATEDLEGNTRPQGLGYDMGCYESSAAPAQYILTVTIVGQGTVMLNPAGGIYDNGTVVTLTAVPNSGCNFMGWSGALTGSTNPETITMNADKNVTTTFNCPPDTPAASSPADEAILAEGTVTVPLDTSIFSDPDSGDTHTESHWLVRRADSIYYRTDYDASFDTVITTGPLTQHTVSGLNSGMKYVWKIGYTDSGSGQTSWSTECSFMIGTSEADSSVVIESGTEEADFTMASFVQWPDHSMSSSAFDLTYDKKYFRIGTYDPTNGSGGYVEYGSSLMIEPGKAYWFLARNGLPITVNGIPVSLLDDIDVGLLFNASNQNGWNMIGCPNAANYNWDDVQVIEYNPNDGSIVFGPTAISALGDPNAYIDKRLWRWESGSYYPDATLMEKYKGYWVKANKANVFLRFRVIAQTSSISNPHTMFARILSNGKKWMKRWVFTPQVASADSNDSPPRPMGDFSTVSPESVGGCFIATAVYGSPMERHVNILRDFRDTYLLNSMIGHTFVKAYYRYSPPVADFIAKHETLKAVARMSFLPMVAFCYSALHFGLAVTATGLLLIFMPFIFLVLVYKRRRV